MIDYNLDHTYKLSAMTKAERDNYDRAYSTIKQGMAYDSPREVVEEYIAEKDIAEVKATVTINTYDTEGRFNMSSEEAGKFFSFVKKPSRKERP